VRGQCSDGAENAWFPQKKGACSGREVPSGPALAPDAPKFQSKIHRFNSWLDTGCRLKGLYRSGLGGLLCYSGYFPENKLKFIVARLVAFLRKQKM
jgi:hypothetical protein